MSWREHLAPRSLPAAARASAAFASAGAVMLAALALALPGFTPTAASRNFALGIAVALVALAVVQVRAPERLPFWYWATVPTQALGIVTVLDLTTRDASAAAQAFFVWPVLFGAYELRPRAALVVLAQVLAAQALVVTVVLPSERAMIDLVCVGVTLSVLTLLLVRARESEARVVRELERQAATDPLTGLATRRVLDQAVEAAFASPGRQVTLMLIDVDRFKEINDSLGHPAGDAVLLHVSGLLRAQFPADALVARLGGDELAVLLQDASPSEGRQWADGFRRQVLAEPPVVRGRPVPVTVSVGVATGEEGPLAQLYVTADEALYLAKRGGRNQVHVALGLSREASDVG